MPDEAPANLFFFFSSLYKAEQGTFSGVRLSQYFAIFMSEAHQKVAKPDRFESSLEIKGLFLAHSFTAGGSVICFKRISR